MHGLPNTPPSTFTLVLHQSTSSTTDAMHQCHSSISLLELLQFEVPHILQANWTSGSQPRWRALQEGQQVNVRSGHMTP